MAVQQVRYFLALCAERNLTRAAKWCGVRQPTLSNAIHRLEHELGGSLFVRSNPVQVTALGEALYPHFVDIAKSAKRARRCAVLHLSRTRKTLPQTLAVHCVEAVT